MFFRYKHHCKINTLKKNVICNCFEIKIKIIVIIYNNLVHAIRIHNNIMCVQNNVLNVNAYIVTYLK